MQIVAGIDIGNATTETAVAKLYKNGEIEFLSSSIVKTTGIKGTRENIKGVFQSLSMALERVNIRIEDLNLIRINEAAPVIGDLAMETITETIITESTMIGHNPSTPGGIGIGVGYTYNIQDIDREKTPKILIIERDVDFEEAARIINFHAERGQQIVGAIVQKDDGVLINNRLNKKIPIVDEVSLVEKVPLKMKAAVEVASPGGVIEMLSNPYGIATIFELSPEETKHVVPVSRALIGNRSAVVIKTPKGDVKEKKIPAGKIIMTGALKKTEVSIDEGAERIMEGLKKVSPLDDVKGQPGTNAGGMLEKVRQVMAGLTDKNPSEIKIQDLLAVDTFIPQKVRGGLAEEFSLENAVGIAAMVKSDRLQMDIIASSLNKKLKT
ncbi:MAG: diol dehydratase reactivase subunit alpha, partial [Clostridia bacterium]|nr:diol dehydratase reactivase subunit alpha [Clostridia bacterium]